MIAKKEQQKQIEQKEEDYSKKLLNHKRNKDKKDSNEKKVCLYEKIGSEEIIQEEKVFKTLQSFSSYLLKLKNPYIIIGNEIVELDTMKGQYSFFYNSKYDKIYQKQDNAEIFQDYYLYYSIYETAKDGSIKITYPMILNELLLAPKFFFNLPEKNCPKFYRPINEHHSYLLSFFYCDDINLFQLYTRKKSGASFYFMKQMSRWNEYFIYLDFRKLKKIVKYNENNKKELNAQLKKFIFYSLFNIEAIHYTIKEGFQKIENYYYSIWAKIYNNIPVTNINTFIKALLDSYIELYNSYIHEIIFEEKEPDRPPMLIFIIDHYNYEIDYDYFSEKLNSNDRILKFLISHSLSSKNEINELFRYLDDKNYKFEKPDESSKGIAVSKNKTMVAYYREMFAFNKENFEDTELNILQLYKNELIDNFGLSNPDYIYKFIDYMKDKNQDNKNNEEFSKFLKIISYDIELDIKKFYSFSLAEEYFFVSKYYDTILERKGEIEQENFDNIKRTIPLDYFNIQYSTTNKNILDIVPSCNLVKRILLKKSKNFASIIYQSDYYEKADPSGKGKILQNAIEEKIKNEPFVLFNFFEKNLVFELKYLIPTPKNIQYKKNDPVEKYYKAKKGEIKNDDQNILSYISDEEKKDMENLFKIFSKSSYQNIIIIETDPYTKNYDMGIIKFINESQFIIILFQDTVSRDKQKFGGINKALEKDIAYLTDKFEQYLLNYKSAGVYLIYVLDKDENNNVNTESVEMENPKKQKLKDQIKTSSRTKSMEDDNKEEIFYKDGLNAQLKNNVYLLYYDRKYLNFFTEDGKLIKELIYKDENLQFITSNNLHYFSDENSQKIFDKIIDIFSPEIGIHFINSYDYSDIIGNYLIFSKIDNEHFTVVINIEGKKKHSFDIKKNFLNEVTDMNYGVANKSYYFEIKNPRNISPISVFAQIDLNKSKQ